MATRLYLRNVLAANAPTAGEKSTNWPNAIDTHQDGNTGTTETRSLLTTKGAAQTSITRSSIAHADHDDQYLARFTSDPLEAQTVSANTWNVAFALSEGNASANSFLGLSVYVWRPSNSSVVGFVYDTHVGIGVEWTNTEDGIVTTFSGGAVTASEGDVLVCEVWRHTAAQAHSTAYTQTIYFEGTTDVVDATSSDAASYIETPQTLTFYVPPAPVTWGMDVATMCDPISVG